MVITVRIPGVLRPVTDGQAQVEVEVADGGTVGGVLDSLAIRYPLLGRRLRDERGCLRRYVNCYLDGEDCRQLRGQDTPVTDGSEIQVLPSVAGG